MATSTEFTISRRFNAPRAQVFAAWTDADQVAQWWGPKGFTVPHSEAELRVGGHTRLCMRSPDGMEFWNKSVYVEITSPERIMQRVNFADKNGNTIPAATYGMVGFPDELIMTTEFSERDGQTTVTIHQTQTVPADVATKYGAVAGWNGSFEKLDAYLAQRKAA